MTAKKKIATPKSSVARTPTKVPAKNRPCPCGSGKKYKKCCMPKDLLAGQGADQKLDSAVNKALNRKPGVIKPKDSLAGISKDELLKRDQVILLAQHETKEKMINLDLQHLDRLEVMIKELRAFISQQPPSRGRDGALGDINNQLETLQQQRDRTIFSRPNEVLMLSLRALLNDSHIVKHKAEETMIVVSVDRQLEQQLEPADLKELAQVLNVDDVKGGEQMQDPKDPKQTIGSDKPMSNDGEIMTDDDTNPDDDFDNEDTV